MTDTDLDEAQLAEETDSEEKHPLSLDVKVSSPSACQRHITVTISREDIDRYMREAFTELMPKAAVPGFRAGRAPRKLVESRFRDEVTDQIKGSLLMDSLTQISDEHAFSSISEPDFDFEAIEVPKDGPMTFEFDLEVRPEFDMPEWKGLTLEKPVREVQDDDVQRRVKELLGRFGVLEPQDGPAGDDDYVVVDITCWHDGEVLSESKEQTIQIRPTLSFRDGNLPGFDKLMIGAKEGDKKTGTATVSPDADDQQLRGKEVEVTLEVLEVKRLSIPELDDDFLSRIGAFESEDAFLDFIKGDLGRQLEYHQNQRVRQQITSLLTESADWELPPDLLRRQAQRELDRAIMELRRSGFSDEEIRAHTNVLRQNSQASTATALKEHFILERIAEDEDIEASDNDYDTEIELIAAQSDESPRSVRARLDKRGLMDALRNQIIERKVVQLITEHATFKEIEFKPQRNETVAIDHALAGVRTTDIPDAKHAGDVKELSQPTDYS